MNKKELNGIKRVLKLTDGYLSTQNQNLLLAYDGGIMICGELREHIKLALQTKILEQVK